MVASGASGVKHVLLFEATSALDATRAMVEPDRSMATFSNVIGFDDAPFARTHRGDILVVGVVCSRTRLDGIVSSRIRRDGANSTSKMIAMIQGSQFAGHVQAVLLQGIAVGGFNVVDVHMLHRTLGLPVLVVARHQPNFEAIRSALFTGAARLRGEASGVKRALPGAARKWRLIESAGPMEPLRSVFVQRIGLSRSEAGELVRMTTLHGNLPEPLRLAHLIVGGVTTGSSRGRA
jgi:endonuclease V-like protein UPF0215 family